MLIRCLRGLGDAVYTYPVVKHFATLQPITVVTPYPLIFDKLRNVTTTSSSSLLPDLRPSYTRARSSNQGQYADMLDSINLKGLPFTFDWPHGFTEDFLKSQLFNDFMSKLNDSRKKLAILKEPSTAHMHKHSLNFAAAPDVGEIQNYLDDNRHHYFFVSVGQKEVFTQRRLQGINFDMNDKISVQDLITLCSMAQVIITQVGHLVPISQALRIPVKVFYPANPDKTFRHFSKIKLEIEGVLNLI